MALPRNLWTDINKWVFRLLVLMFGTFAIAALFGMFFTEIFFHFQMYSLFTTLAQFSMIAGGVLMLAWLLSGLMTLPQLADARKRKSHSEATYSDYQDDARMNAILSRLSSEEQDYIREQMASKQMGLSDDGELIALDDLASKKKK